MYALSEMAGFGPPLFVSKRGNKCVAESHRRVAIVTLPRGPHFAPAQPQRAGAIVAYLVL
jgi:hypothetical protein